jgi:hypothetical protein
MLQLLTCLLPHIPEESHVAESQVLLQIGDPRDVGAESLGSVIITEPRIGQGMLGMLDHHLMSPQIAHLVVDTLSLPRRVPFNLVDRVAVRDYSNLPTAFPVRVYV